jgi:hypothetical protein
MARFIHYKTDDWCDKFFSKVGGFLLVVRLQVPLPIQLTARFDWNIVESGVDYPYPWQLKCQIKYTILCVVND